MDVWDEAFRTEGASGEGLRWEQSGKEAAVPGAGSRCEGRVPVDLFELWR